MRDAGYILACDEDEPDPLQALLPQFDASMNSRQRASFALFEKIIRDRDVFALRGILSLNGHDIRKPKECRNEWPKGLLDLDEESGFPLNTIHNPTL